MFLNNHHCHYVDQLCYKPMLLGTINSHTGIITTPEMSIHYLFIFILPQMNGDFLQSFAPKP